jgi:hypothetical protein
MRFRLVTLLASGMVAASTACSMDATAPSSLAVPERAAMSRGQSGSGGEKRAPTVDRFITASAVTYSVTIDPKQPNLLRFGPHTLELPANSICNVDSSYGVPSFDLPCRTAKKRVTITAMVRSTANGIPRIDLYPAMRFEPTQVVTLRLFVPHLSSWSSIPRILYCATPIAEQCVDEAELDPTLATQVDYRSSTLFRRVKHFSGYFVEW